MQSCQDQNFVIIFTLFFCQTFAKLNPRFSEFTNNIFFQVCVFYVQTQTSLRNCTSGSGLNQLCAKKLGPRDLLVYTCHRKAFCQYDFHQDVIWKLILKLTLPPIICYG